VFPPGSWDPCWRTSGPHSGGFPGGGNVPIGVYANVGTPGDDNGAFLRDVSPAAYAEFARSWVHAGVSLVGGCCGTTPEYIRAAAGAFAAERHSSGQDV